MRRLGWLWAVPFLFACPGKKEAPDAGAPAGPQQLAEKEPNDRLEQALAISADTQVSASLSADPAKPDEDWYLLQTRRAEERRPARLRRARRGRGDRGL